MASLSFLDVADQEPKSEALVLSAFLILAVAEAPLHSSIALLFQCGVALTGQYVAAEISACAATASCAARTTLALQMIAP